MADATAIDDVAGRPAVFCRRCAADVTALPSDARFCNRCGFHLPERPPPESKAPATAAAEGVPPRAGVSPLILIAYAKAMFNLGWRYETSVGSRRNLPEAARCYWKAARLGDDAARERLGSATADGATLAYRPPHLPAHAGATADSTPPFASVHRSSVP